MEKNKIKLIKEFVMSDQDESEFFGVSKENSITLEEYYDYMKDVDRRFQKMAQFEIESIKKKCPWVKEVWFEGLQNAKTKEFFLTSIHFFSVDGREIYTNLNKKTDTYDYNFNIPKLYLLSKKVRADVQRKHDFAKIQEELKEIEKIGHDIYDDKFHRKDSISETFDACYRPDGGLYLFSDYNLVTAFLKPCVKNYDKPIIKDKNSNRVLKKILLKD